MPYLSEIYANRSSPCTSVESMMFPWLFPFGGIGVYDCERSRPLTFKKYRASVLLNHPLKEQFKKDIMWMQWSEEMVDAIEAIKKGEAVIMDPKAETTKDLQLETVRPSDSLNLYRIFRFRRRITHHIVMWMWTE